MPSLPPTSPRSEGAESRDPDERTGLFGPLVDKLGHFFRVKGSTLILGAALAGSIAILIYSTLIAVHRIPVPFKTSESAHSDYCYEIACRASMLANIHFVTGIGMTAIVIVAGYCAVSHGNTAEAPYRGTAAALVVLLGAPASFMMFRLSDAAVELAAVANEAGSPDSVPVVVRAAGATSSAVAPRPPDPERAYAICSKAWSAWIRSRMESNAIGRAALEENLKLKSASPPVTSTASASASVEEHRSAPTQAP